MPHLPISGMVGDSQGKALAGVHPRVEAQAFISYFLSPEDFHGERQADPRPRDSYEGEFYLKEK